MTEQKTILEELIEDAPLQRERRRKLAKAKHCISREEWDDAAALLFDILAEHPDDEDAQQELRIMNEKIEAAEKRLREAAEREAAEREAEEQRRAQREAAERALDNEKFMLDDEEEEEREPKTGGPKKSFVAVLLVLIMVAAAVAAVLGITSHRRDVQEQLDAADIIITETFVVNTSIQH